MRSNDTLPIEQIPFSKMSHKPSKYRANSVSTMVGQKDLHSSSQSGNRQTDYCNLAAHAKRVNNRYGLLTAFSVKVGSQVRDIYIVYNAITQE